MMGSHGKSRFTAFLGRKILARGSVEAVVLAAKDRLDAGAAERLAIFDDEEARIHDFDFRGSREDVLSRLDGHPLLSGQEAGGETRGERKRGPGRPRLGVVSGEVTLLPRHWAWLRSQKSGASATIRRLVEDARRKASPEDRARKAQEAAYRFISDMAADLPGFEEASRALFSGRHEDLARETEAWPSDLRAYLSELLRGAGEPGTATGGPTSEIPGALAGRSPEDAQPR